MKRKTMFSFVIALVLAATVFVPMQAFAAEKHKEASSAFLNCSYYYQKGNVPNKDLNLHIDNTHHYVGASIFTAKYKMKVKIKRGKTSQTITFKNNGEKKIKKAFRGKKCKVTIWGVHKDTGKKTKSKTWKKVKL